MPSNNTCGLKLYALSYASYMMKVGFTAVSFLFLHEVKARKIYKQTISNSC
jgi:hypothetical protein